MDHICKNDVHHFEDVPLSESLVMGKVYEKVASRKVRSCIERDKFHWLAWVRYDFKDCGIELIVSFSEDPPDFFMLNDDGGIVEVVKDATT